MEALMERKRINPPSLFQHPAFTRVVTVKGPCKFIFIAGLTAADINYKCVAPGDCRAQYIDILKNLTVQLEAAGATWDDVVFRRIYALDVDAFLNAQADTSIPTPWSPGCAPPSTLIGVTRLSSPDFVLEVDLTAVVAA
jgi:enamine deaminase RidA (YjgF/YER057c/UK114 family)